MDVGSPEDTPLGGLWLGLEVTVGVELGSVAEALVGAGDVVGGAVVGAVVEVVPGSLFVFELESDLSWDKLLSPSSEDEFPMTPIVKTSATIKQMLTDFISKMRMLNDYV